MLISGEKYIMETDTSMQLNVHRNQRDCSLTSHFDNKISEQMTWLLKKRTLCACVFATSFSVDINTISANFQMECI